MPLEPFFSVTPKNSRIYTYNPQNPNSPYALADLNGFGIWHHSYLSRLRFAQQCENDEVIMGFNAVDPSNQSASGITDFYQQCSMFLTIAGYNVNQQNQYLVVMQFGIKHPDVIPIAQFFVDTTLVRIEKILSNDAQVALLVDCPGPSIWVRIFVRLAGPSYTYLGFKGATGYLL